MQSDLTKLYEKQISLTEWFEAIGHPQTAKLREEDAHKHDRLDILNKIIGLPFGKPIRFLGTAVAERSAELSAYIADHGDEFCAIRLIPKKPHVPKLRIRGHTIRDSLVWFDKQKVDPTNYDVDFVPHDNPKWASIFIVSDKGISGEVKRGNPSQLTQGVYTDESPITFSYDFKTWHFGRIAPEAQVHIAEVIDKLKVGPKLQSQLRTALDADFSHDYLKGYFETSTSDEYGIWFIDYNRLLGDIYTEGTLVINKDALVTGRCGSPGLATGRVHIVKPDNVADTTLTAEEILVCTMTSPDYLPLMQQAAAVVTDLGGVLSHAAIIARELKKPCITGTKNATTTLTAGQRVTVDAENGTVLAA
jgi:phosphohistidine swiveling domain-containing protein